MSAVISSLVSEFDSEKQAMEYDQWFREQIQASLDDTSPCIPHEQVMAEMDAIIRAAERNQRKIA